jgi:hypothetical protein
MMSGRRTKRRIQIARTARKEKKMGQREYPKGGKSKVEKKQIMVRVVCIEYSSIV